MCVYNDMYVYSLNDLFHRGFLPHDIPIQSGYIQILTTLLYPIVFSLIFTYALGISRVHDRCGKLEFIKIHINHSFRLFSESFTISFPHLYLHFP